MVHERKLMVIEFTAVILLWALVILSPLFYMDDQQAVRVMWAEWTVVGFAFLVNRFILMPSFFFAKKYERYILSLILLLVVLAILILYFDVVNLILSLFGADGGVKSNMMPMMNGAPPRGMPPHVMPHQGMPPVDMPHSFTIIPPMVSVFIISLIVIALDTGLSISVKWIVSEQRQADINRERTLAQLNNLQSQVSPHFFMNTLNNIHALVDIDSKRAKQTIIEMSGLMDYLLYESSNRDRVLLQRELEFINNYINLMKLRLSKEVKISFVYSCDIPSVEIPPLLFINFIENAFKYGVDYESESFIKIHISCNNDFVEMTTINSNHSQSVKSSRHGLGIENSRKRLDLLYGDAYSLNISDIDKIFFTNLKVPII